MEAERDLLGLLLYVKRQSSSSNFILEPDLCIQEKEQILFFPADVTIELLPPPWGSVWITDKCWYMFLQLYLEPVFSHLECKRRFV
jgi:hypothetical protein